MEHSPKLLEIDLNSLNFYDQLQDEIDSDMARLKKNVTIMKNLRLTAAEMEVETAALFHTELWHDIENLKIMNESNDEEPQQAAQNS